MKSNSLVPFQCELYHYRNMKNLNPSMSVEDINLLRFIRRMNLDAFWTRESGTVNKILRDGKKMERLSNNLSLEYILPIMGSFYVKDTQGMSLVVIMLLISLHIGIYQCTL